MVPVAILISIAVIVLLTTKYNVHPFFALLFACFVMGIGLQLPAAEIIAISKDGFGNILKSLGFILVLGTTLGVVLEHTGATQVMASFLLRRVGDTNAPFAMSLTGFVVGLPIFCDSGYIVLSGLNNALSRRTGASIAVMATALATGLYSVHCLIPPHPGATAAAAAIGVDYGKLILAGIVVAIPAMLVGYAWARHAGKNENTTAYTDNVEETSLRQSFSPLKAFLPVAVPILLIAAKSFFAMEPGKTAPWLAHLLVLGDPVLALSVGTLLAFACKSRWNRTEISQLLATGVEKAANVIVIIGAGGAFGAILAAANLGSHFNSVDGFGNLGLFMPFLLTFILKTAQGSSTVAIITAASIIQLLLPALGLTSDSDKLLAVLAMGAGSMTISHANDAYFWVISKFSGIPVKTTLKIYTTATVFMSITSLLMIYLLRIFLSY